MSEVMAVRRERPSRRKLVIDGRKECCGCHEWKRLSEYSPSKRTSTGTQSRCRECAAKWFRRHYLLNREKQIARTAIWHRAHKAELNRRVVEKLRNGGQLEPANRKPCRRAYMYALKRGELKRQACLHCGNPITQGHHHDYNQPLNVTWLCRKHHEAWHRLFVPEEPKGANHAENR